jgi:hypothetical protein
MASGNPPVRGFRSTVATAAQVEALEAKFTDILAGLFTRLAITEHAMSQVIQDLYYPPEAEDGFDDDAVAANEAFDGGEGGEEGTEYEGGIAPTASELDERVTMGDPEAAALIASELRAEAEALNEGSDDR